MTAHWAGPTRGMRPTTPRAHLHTSTRPHIYTIPTLHLSGRAARGARRRRNGRPRRVACVRRRGAPPAPAARRQQLRRRRQRRQRWRRWQGGRWRRGRRAGTAAVRRDSTAAVPMAPRCEVHARLLRAGRGPGAHMHPARGDGADGPAAGEKVCVCVGLQEWWRWGARGWVAAAAVIVGAWPA
eukprot:364629-Chlamydomonas_euryale.AAC.2